MSFASNSFKILDCTIRDGGYVNNWRFDKEMVREVYRALSKAGVDIVEIGFRGTGKYFEKDKFGPWRFTDIGDLKYVVEGITGADLAIMGDFGKIGIEDFSDDYKEFISVIRIAVHKDGIKDAISLLEELKKKGYKVSLNAMGITSYTVDEIKKLKRILKDSDIDYLYIADSYGSILPDQMKSLIEQFKELSPIKIGFHPHNSLQMAFANTLEAIRCGIDIIDCTLFGIGRGAGNLPTEVLLSYLQLSTVDKYNVIPVLNCIDRFFTNMEGAEPWGYQLPYMLSGIFKCHPYYPKTLLDFREYSMEDIWNALEILRKINPIGFKKDLLYEIINSGVVGGSTNKRGMENVYSGIEINQEKQEIGKKTTVVEVSSTKFVVPYIERHNKRDFLVLANGPTLKEYKNKIEIFIEKYKPIILGANYLGGLFKPHYHAFNNKKRFIDYVDFVDKDSKLLIGQNISEAMIKEYTSRDYEVLYYDDKLNADFDIIDGVIPTNCRTISVLLMGVAIVMGANRIFAVGMDGYIGTYAKDGFHFYDEKVEPEDKKLIIERHSWNQRFIEQIDGYLDSKGKEGIHILTPTSYKLFYKGIENYI